jgi:two-component system, response regulator YesN
MRTVMIVDDESLVRVGFQTIIDWESHGYQISGLYKNGLQAWEAIQLEGPPDVLLTDIKMPEMDGLVLIRNIREENKDCNIIILSSHDEFNYLRSSINLRVQDYILKHTFEPDELIETLNKLDYLFSKKESNLTNVTLEKEKQLLLKESRNLSHDSSKEKEIDVGRYPSMVKKWGINNVQGYWISITTYPNGNSYLISELRAISYQLQELINEVSSMVYVGMDQQIIHAFCTIDSDSIHTYEKVFEKWISSILQKLDIPIIIGTSKKNYFSKSLVKMRVQAERAINKSFYLGKGIYYCDQDKPTNRIPDKEWADLKGNVAVLLISNDINSIITWIDKYGTQFAMNYVPEEEAVRFLKMVYMSFLERRVEISMDWNIIEDSLHSNLISYEKAIVNSVPVWKEMVEITRILMEEHEEHSLNKVKVPWLEVVIKYIKEHYTEPIRLEEVARVANFNENYFSHLFRKEMGITFLDYVTSLRIEKAIKLLKDSRLSTEEISQQIGYPNGNYFVRVFKKVTGITISEFRSNPNSILKV